jgi:hypothetical protein
LAVLMAVAACGGGTPKGENVDTASQEDVALPTGPDPCALVSQAEMEALIGPLAEPPFRVDSDRQPKADGEGCFYRARDRRNVVLSVDWEDGEMYFQMLAGIGQAITDILSGYDPATDTLEGNWDKVGSAFGQFIALKGKTSVQVDPLASRIGLEGAARLASIGLGRIGSPLDYSGAKATLARSEDAPQVRNPCALVTRQEAEALMGPLKSDPRPSADSAECDYPTTKEFLGSPVVRTLKVTWVDGFYAFGQERMGIEGGAKVMAAQMGDDLPALSQSAAGEAEPWDERVTLLGGLVTVVRRDVLLQLAGEGTDGFDEAKALAFLRIAAGRL